MTILTIIPQILILIGLFIQLLYDVFMDGQMVSNKINWYKITAKVAFTNVMLWLGGFFNHIGIPQFIYISLTAIGFYILFTAPNNQHPSIKESKYFGLFLTLLIYYWGNFFDPLINFIN